MSRCECADQCCPEHKGAGECGEESSVELERVDMDPGGIWFCEGCADDALESGLFRMLEEAS